MRYLLLFLALFLGSIGIAQAQVAVIVHKDVAVDQVDSGTLEDIYALEQNKWDDGSRIVRFDLNAEDGVKQAFYGFIGTQASDIKKVWLRKKLSGEAQPPESIAASAVVQKVSSTPASIGYVSADAVTDAVKVVATIE